MRFALRATLFDFAADPSHTENALRVIDDGMLLIEDGVVAACGDYRTLRSRVDAATTLLDYSGCLATPGFVDTHIHLPQIDVIASPAAGLLDWL